jgi:hypothetical protein
MTGSKTGKQAPENHNAPDGDNRPEHDADDLDYDGGKAEEALCPRNHDTNNHNHRDNFDNPDD